MAISTKRRKADREQVRCDAFQNNGPLPGMESDPDSSLESDSSDDSESDGSESEYDFVESEHQLNEEDLEEDPAKDLDNQLCPPADINFVLKYEDSAGSYLRGPYGAGSKATTKRKAQDQRERAKIASTSYSISALLRSKNSFSPTRLQESERKAGRGSWAERPLSSLLSQISL